MRLLHAAYSPRKSQSAFTDGSRLEEEAKAQPEMTLDQQAEILFIGARRKMRSMGLNTALLGRCTLRHLALKIR